MIRHYHISAARRIPGLDMQGPIQLRLSSLFEANLIIRYSPEMFNGDGTIESVFDGYYQIGMTQYLV